MESLATLPFVRLSVDKHGALAAPIVLPDGITDLIVISHGWKNSTDDALDLYETLIGHVQEAAGPAFTDAGRRWGVAGIFWPAFRFQPDLTLLSTDGSAGHVEAVAAMAVGADGDDLSRAELAAIAVPVAEELGEDPAQFAAMAVAAAQGGADANAFVDGLRSRLTLPDAKLKADHADLMDEKVSGAALVNQLRPGIDTVMRYEFAQPDEAHAAASFTDAIATVRQWRRGGKAAVASLLNQATYYEMKARAGLVGEALAPVIENAVSGDVRVHLVGHSFGARLVTALANGLTTLYPTSLSLLQGAFSHNGFGYAGSRDAGAAGVDGAFRKVIADKRISGPLMVTHTRNDTAVGLAYAMASTLSRQVAAGLTEVANAVIGGPSDRHGGIGANGARSLQDGEGVAHVAIPTQAPPTLTAGKVNNVRADTIVSDHNDVTNAGVAQFVWAAIR
ncbi:hypothetical protein [Sphingobium yanoikuyae]|uniref:hypothetical protein n=1 Tax=Sphingobium yanoikuyae TaxID=13690 RepID=UPI0028A8B8F3|nr:hypothetical protein [Sphingobium yanoikuyae]